MEAEVPKLGSSLLVPSVKELIKQPITKVPTQYIHPNQDPVVVSCTTSLSEIPVIDLSKLLSEDESELEKLHHACKEWGFFQVINHGVNPSLVENVKIGVKEFFNLPMKEKKKLRQKPGDLEGFGQLFVVSEEQKLEWADMFSMNTHPLYTRNPHLFPSIPQPCIALCRSVGLALPFVVATLARQTKSSMDAFVNEHDI
ncbi:putative thebaine 6-O-demethylase [Lupinus albus]|uniref:Putative thebaine 6-O-demethylase n=1 Tax=Lupinus albus TaxID=3870 RepID=A0A6A4P5T0_LUPAL|nr:putative thebaine 6-O-demethylase [Lupinus albus]